MIRQRGLLNPVSHASAQKGRCCVMKHCAVLYLVRELGYLKESAAQYAQILVQYNNFLYSKNTTICTQNIFYTKSSNPLNA